MYERVQKYLDIPNRIEVLNQRLDIIRELYVHTGLEAYRKHSELLI